MWIVPKRISRSMPGEPDWTWDSNELTRMLSVSLTWNTKQAQPRSWSITLKRNYWMPHLCSRMPSPSRQDAFTDWWTGSLADRRASRSQSQESNAEPMTRATSGRSLSEWWERFSQEAASSRMSHQPSLFGTSTRTSSPDFSIWATKLRQGYSQRLRSARHTTGSESSSWPTPDTTPAGPNGQFNISAAAILWQTPANFQGKYRRQANQTERNEMLLPGQAENWPTPNAADSKRESAHARGNPSVGMAAQMWDTPDTAPDAPNSGSNRKAQVAGLGNQAKMWATPTASDDEHKVTVNSHQAGLVGEADRFAGRPVQQALKNGGKLSKSDQTSLPRLNPAFVTWLMNWPDAWLRFHALKNCES